MSSYSEGQSHQLMERLEKENFTAHDVTLLGQSEQLQKILSYLHGSAEIIITHVLRLKSFNPEELFSWKGWVIYEKLHSRGYLNAEKIIAKDYLKKGESSINGEEYLRRVKAEPTDVQLGANDFITLWQEEGHTTLKWLYATKSITFLSFFDTILQETNGEQYILHLYREDDGSWHWGYRRIAHGIWDADNPAGVLQK
ncbi:MAG: hypothetical protein WCT08_01725 [Patescibacteria group bacterium]